MLLERGIGVLPMRSFTNLKFAFRALDYSQLTLHTTAIAACADMLVLPGHAQETVVLRSAAGKDATKEVLEAHSIPKDVSPDLKDLSAFGTGENRQPSPTDDSENIIFAGL